MEDGRIIVTREDIAEYLIKVNKINFLIGSVAVLVTVLLFQVCKWVSARIFWDILCIFLGLLWLFSLLLRIRLIQKIKNGTYFTITTDVLRSKNDHIVRVGNDAIRLYFQCDQYTMCFRYIDRYCIYLAYDMDYQTLYDIATVGDTYTLIKAKKDVLLAYNNKFFDVHV